MVRRAPDNVRKRNNSYRRHNPTTQGCEAEDVTDLVSETKIEWMSINYRMEKISQLSDSKKRIILLLF